MRKKILKISGIFLSYLWHVGLFLIVYPYLIYYIGKQLDDLFWTHLLKRDFVFYIQCFSEAVGASFIVLGVGIILWSASVLARHSRFFPFESMYLKNNKPQKVSQKGPYGKVRHPMLLGYLLVLAGGAVLTRSLFALAWTVPLYGWAAYEYMVDFEEKKLLSWFGKEYSSYREKIPALFPRFKNIKG